MRSSITKLALTQLLIVRPSYRQARSCEFSGDWLFRHQSGMSFETYCLSEQIWKLTWTWAFLKCCVLIEIPEHPQFQHSFSGLPASRNYHSVLNQQNIASKFQHCYFMAPFSKQCFEARSHSSKIIPPESLSAFSWNMISGTSSVPCWFSMVTASSFV